MEKIQQALERARHERQGALMRDPTENKDITRAEVTDGSAFPMNRVSPRLVMRNRIVAWSADERQARFALPGAEAFRMLRAQVLQRLTAMGARSLAITSPHDADGKSLVAVNLAMTLAKQFGRGAVLVDADLRRPSLASYLGVKPRHDVSEFLEERVGLDQCISNSDADGLVMLLQSASSRRSPELLAARMNLLVSGLKELFANSIIIFDCPPLLATEDALVISQHVDACLLVVREGVTTKTDLRRAVELIGEERYLGTVLNNSRWNNGLYHHYY